MNIELRVKGIKGEIKILGKKPDVKELEVYEGRFMLIVDEKDLVKVNSKVDIIVLEGGKELQTINTSFLGKVAE